MPTADLQLDPARVADEGVRLHCPRCGETCIREHRAGTPTTRRINVECINCTFSELHEFATAAPDLPPPQPPPASRKDSTMTPDPYETLTRSEKMRWAWVKKVMPGLSIAKWIEDGKQTRDHYLARQSSPRKPRISVKHEPAPRVQVAPAPQTPAVVASGSAKLAAAPCVDTGESIMTIATSLIETAAKQGGRCRVVIFDMELGK